MLWFESGLRLYTCFWPIAVLHYGTLPERPRIRQTEDGADAARKQRPFKWIDDETQFVMKDKAEAATGARPRRLSLDDLVPEKAAVSTSLGTLYVRPITISISDSKVFECHEAAELGRAIVLKVASRIQDKRDSTSLADEDFDALLEADIEALAPVIADNNNWEALPVGAGVVDLGNAAKRGREQALERLNKIQDDLRASIGSSYAFLGNSALEKLQEQMVGLSNIRQSMSAAENIKAAMEASNVWGQTLLEPSTETRRAADEMQEISRINFVPEFERSRSMEIPSFALQSPEDTPLGRATLEGAENSRETVQRMDALVEVVGGLNQTIVKDVLPAWFATAKSDQENAEQAFKTAGKSLKWTKWAVIASVFVSIVATWGQISVTREIDRENSVAQQRSESLLREQLASQRTNESLLREQLVAQRKLAEQQSLEMTRLQQLIKKQSMNSEKLQALQKVKRTAPIHK
jgi:hypothetical protein